MYTTTTYSPNTAISAGVAAGVSAVSIILYLAVVVLLIIGWWKLFTKAGEPGWKSIIPIYNVYTFCKIIGINFWIFCLAIPVGLGILLSIAMGGAVTSLAAGTGTGLSAFSGLALVVMLAVYGYAIFLDIFTAIKLGNAFGKSTGFKVGLVFLPNIFLLILAFGKDKYIGAKAAAKKD